MTSVFQSTYDKIFYTLEERKPLFYIKTENEIYEIKRARTLSKRYLITKIINKHDSGVALLTIEQFQEFLNTIDLSKISDIYPFGDIIYIDFLNKRRIQ